MSEDSPRPKKQDEGLPAYMGTFADLMSLLMCFFVLLLSFAEMDALKYKMVVKSLDNAFGVQREVIADAVPVGTSIIAQEYSPGEPKPTPLKVVRQETIDDTREKIKVTMDEEEVARQQAQEIAEETQKFREALDEEIKEGLIDELHLFVNPAAVGKGMSIFNKLDQKQDLKLFHSQAFDCGINVLAYSLK